MRSPALMEKQLRAALVRPGTRLRVSELNGDTLAWIEYEGQRYDVTLDPFRGGLIECTIHELIHAVYKNDLRVWGKLEETIVLAVEKPVVERVNIDPTRVRWWRANISAKLDGEDD